MLDRTQYGRGLPLIDVAIVLPMLWLLSLATMLTMLAWTGRSTDGTPRGEVDLNTPDFGPHHIHRGATSLRRRAMRRWQGGHIRRRGGGIRVDHYRRVWRLLPLTLAGQIGAAGLMIVGVTRVVSPARSANHRLARPDSSKVWVHLTLLPG